ncbi:MAG: calcium-binding protein [Oscillatoriales cyanobacterium RM2_1_1]|nr:calcium-binding protein [Oscillatoriales cyanobacterium RM2_1_1]
MFNRILNFLVDQAWPFAKPFVEVIFPEYKPVINLVDKVVTPWLDQLLEDFEVTIDGSSLIDVTKILNEPDVLKEYQALTQRSADSSKLYLLTENTDILAPTGMPIPFSATGEIQAQWTEDNSGGILALGGDDFLIGSSQIDFINGNQGDDLLAGAGGNDLIRGGKGDDAIAGDSGNDIINGNRDRDLLQGGEGDDFLRGGKDNDTLQGGAGNDILIGDLGTDVLSGGTGADQFILATSPELQTDVLLADVIMDLSFTEGDRIRVVADFTASNLSFESFNGTANLTLANGSTQGTILREVSSGNILGVVADVTNADLIRDNVTLVSPNDAVLLIG